MDSLTGMCIETTSTYKKTYQLTSDKHSHSSYAEIESIIKSYIDELSSFDVSETYVILHNGKDTSKETIKLDINDIDATISTLNMMYNATDLSKLTVETTKPDNNELKVIDVNCFLASIKDKPLVEQVKFWGDNFKKRYSCIVASGMTVHVYYESDRETMSGLSSRTSFELDALGVNPEYFTFLMDKLSSISGFIDYFLTLRNCLCFIFLSNNDLENEKVVRFGHNAINLDELSWDYHLDSNAMLYKIYKWCFSDEKHGTKLGIVNHVLSQNKNNQISFDDNLFMMIKSHYQFHLRNEFDGYLEIRNKLSESTLDVCTRLSDYISSIDKTILQILFVILSYFFSIVVFTGIDKGKFENVFSIELASLTTVFIIGALLAICFANNDYEKKVKICQLQLSETKKRNEYFLSDDEIKDFFQSDSMNEVIDSTKNRWVVYLSYTILFVLLCLVWIFYSIRHELISIPVFLHIV
ncbi:hypothetical protein NMT25_002801 [Vibrio cholerae]|uniref:hypothetical protein n=1 Tax=Vibrio cholerae TaxID=666 RepID=UPI000B96D7B4|nr:hypothetical protein [Vibrio cholerae]EGQ9983385.1 hypothetical protein [Vibrio cholerae]EGR1084673.1 hypothetical protein [Vibrio cholerae]EGR4228715.1 hypothetical protein [Vibrio cholerae]EHD7114059.1 hypothetical protein [Vibrio cholerae]EJL6611224.1 hypothetical protein [Vibrio cholerae]